MSKHDFTRAEFQQRCQRTREAIRARGLDWFLVFHPVTIRWLTGSDAKSYQEFQTLLVSAEDGPLIILSRDGETNELLTDTWIDDVHAWGGGEPDDPIAALARLADHYGLNGKRIGMEVPGYYLHPLHYVRLKELFSAPPIVEANSLVWDLTLVKSPQELAYIRRAAELADEAMLQMLRCVSAGKSELELAGEVYGTLLKSGSGLAGSPINLVTGPRCCYSHGAPTERRLDPGDNGNVEFGATYRRYTSTLGRQFCLGPPSARVRELYEIVLRACDACLNEIRPGAPATAPHAAAKQVIADAGLDHGRVHLSGYGLAAGFPPGWAEPIHLFGENPYTIQAGMILTVEPPIFLGEEAIGVRVIDNVIVTDRGWELLSRVSREIAVL